MSRSIIAIDNYDDDKFCLLHIGADIEIAGGRTLTLFPLPWSAVAVSVIVQHDMSESSGLDHQ